MEGLIGDRGEWFQTFTGRQFYFQDPRPEDIDIDDIAHALAHINRYGGHLPYPWSVAQHSLAVSEFAPPRIQLEALLHDATEAYIGDMVAPLKRTLPEFQKLEEDIRLVIYERFELGKLPMHPIVKDIDLRMLVTEARQLIPERAGDWDRLIGVEAFGGIDLKQRLGDHGRIAKKLFLLRFTELVEETAEQVFRCWVCGKNTGAVEAFPHCAEHVKGED